MKLADCPVFPAEAGNALSTDRGLGWRLARQAGPVLRHPAANGVFANWVFVVGREEVLANLDDARLDRARALPDRDLQVHQELFAPKSAHDVAAVFRPTAAALIDRFAAAAAGGGDAVADVTTPMASALFDSVSRLQLLPVEHLYGRSGHVFSEACRNLFKHAGWHLFELAHRPELCDMLRRQPELIRGFVEEVLRLEPMVPSCQRFTTQPTTVGGVELRVHAKEPLPPLTWLFRSHPIPLHHADLRRSVGKMWARFDLSGPAIHHLFTGTGVPANFRRTSAVNAPPLATSPRPPGGTSPVGPA